MATCSAWFQKRITCPSQRWWRRWRTSWQGCHLPTFTPWNTWPHTWSSKFHSVHMSHLEAPPEHIWSCSCYHVQTCQLLRFYCRFSLQQIIYRWNYIWANISLFNMYFGKKNQPCVVSWSLKWHTFHATLIISQSSFFCYQPPQPITSLVFLHDFLWLVFWQPFFNWRMFHFKSDGEGTGHKEKKNTDKFWKMLTNIRLLRTECGVGRSACAACVTAWNICGTHLIK